MSVTTVPVVTNVGNFNEEILLESAKGVAKVLLNQSTDLLQERNYN